MCLGPRPLVTPALFASAPAPAPRKPAHAVRLGAPPTSVAAAAADVPLSAAAVPPPHVKRHVAVFVEPSPFSHVSGMKVRFASLIKGLRELGDDVTVFTPCVDPPSTFHGAAVVPVLGFPLPFYKSKTLLLSMGISARVLLALMRKRPDVIHVSTPGCMVFAVIAYAKLLSIPLVVSYHTHVPDYIPKYTWAGLVRPMWSVINLATAAADLTLVPSPTMKRVLAENGTEASGIEVWRQAVDTDVFSPKFRSDAWRARLSNGVADPVILTYVGRLGAEKNLEILKDLLAALPPNVCLSLVGDGPARADLEAHFAGTRTHFTGMLSGDDLAAAYASADIFVMPSETETLGFVALEAMASGLAVVCVAAGGLVDIVSAPGEIGYVYPPNDYAALKAVVATLVAEPTTRARVAAAGRKHVEALGWLPAVRSIRDGQYTRAIKTFAGRQAVKLAKWRAALKVAAAVGAVAALVVAVYMGVARLPVTA